MSLFKGISGCTIYVETDDFVEEIRKKYEDKTVLIVTHNSISRALWMIKNGKGKNKEEINMYYHNSENIIIYNNY